MNEEYVIIEIGWDHRIVEDNTGKRKKIIRGVDYDTSWLKLGNGYAKNGNEITFYDKIKFANLYHTIDFKTFELIQSHDVTTNYFRDKNHIYVYSYMHRDISILADANPADFTILNIEDGYSSSGNIDYWYGVKIPFRLKDAIIFKGGSYQKVGDQVYFAFVNNIDCDVDTFEVVDEREHHQTVFRDKNHIYHKGVVLEGANPKTFHFLENCINETLRPYYINSDIHYYAKDDKYAYFVDSVNSIKIIKTKNINSFDFKVINDHGVAFDTNYEYYRGVRKKIKTKE